MLQLWLRCWLTSGLMLCGWAGMFWVGISGIMFRSSLGGLLCRLQLLWGEFSFLLPASLYWFFCGFGFSVFLLLLVVVDYLLIVWFLRFVLISAISILWWWFSVLKCSLLLFILLNDVRCCAFIGFNLRSSRFFQRLCLGFFKISLGLMAGVWMDGFSWY
jgi:hypothetical protein